MTPVTPTLVRDVRDYLLETQVPFPGWGEGLTHFQAAVTTALVKLDAVPRGNGEVHRLAGEVARRLTGVGVLQPLLDDPQDTIQEIIVRRGYVQVERAGRIEDLGHLAPDEELADVVARTADLSRRQLTGARPYVLADLPDGARFTAIVPPLSVAGTAINIRRFPRNRLGLPQLEARGTFKSPADDDTAPAAVPPTAGGNPLAAYLATVARRVSASLLISGEFSAGKSTLLGALASLVPAQVQVAVVETFQEVQLAHPRPLRVVVPGDREAFPSLDEVLNVVVTRMRPDLLVVGEIVRDEAPRFLDAVNLGKRAWATIHAGSALGALYRLESKALASGLPHQAVREQIALSVDLVIHMARVGAARRVVEVALVQGLTADGAYDLHYLPVGRVRPRATALRALWEAHT